MSSEQQDTAFDVQADESYWAALFTQEKKYTTQSAADESGPSRAEFPFSSSPLRHDAWQLAAEAFRADQVLQLQVIGYNKGGLLVQWQGLQGFVPASQLIDSPQLHIARERLRALIEMQGKWLVVKIIELNPEINRLVLSERAALVDAEKRVGILYQLRPGDEVLGRVTNLTDFGAFVDLGGIEGLIHISELSWSRVIHPSHIVQPGQNIRVKVLRVDRERERIALSIKQLKPDPWATAESRYCAGDLVTGVVSNITSYGVFIMLEAELEGLIHVSELAEGDFSHPHNVVDQGDQLTARVIQVDAAQKRLALSLRSL
jgi:small subunit ribosomal protein S1